MNKPLALASALLLSTALTPALAQVAGAPSGPPAGTQSGPQMEATTPPDVAPGPDPVDAADQDSGETEEQIEISAPGSQPNVEEIVVIGTRTPNIIRATPQVVSVLSASDIARTGEGDIAGALNRVTGLSVVGSGFVYVRGLGDRYSLSLLNGSPLPSPEPLRRVVPLDIFPTSVVASAVVQKSYSPNYPGEFGGGVINLTTQSTPREPFLEFNASIGGDTITTDNIGYTYYGSDTDWLGYDDGERSVPGFILDAGANGTRLESSQITGLSNARTTLLQSMKFTPVNWSGGFSGGTTIPVGDDSSVGLIFGGALNSSWTTRDATQQNSDASALILRDFETVTTDQRALLNGLFGIGYNFGDNKIRLTNVYIHDTVKQARLGRGYDLTNREPDPNQPAPIIEQDSFFFERELYDLQGVGEFKFGDFDLDLRGTYANTKRNSPYERSFVYNYNPTIGDYRNNLSGSFETATVTFSALNEDLYAGGADLTWNVPSDMSIAITGGYAYSKAERSSTRYFFRYRGANNAPLDDVTAQLRPDYLLSDYTIITNGITLNPEAASGTTRYNASLVTNAGYVMGDIELVEGLKLSGGVRYEDAEEIVQTNGGFSPTRLSNAYWLPAATLTWELADNMQLRVHGSKTIARPQFRELAPQLYQDFSSDREFFGNPFLTDSELYNAEARYEWYFGRDQRVAVAGFYKKIDRPIEAVATTLPNGQILTGFSNAPSANLYGAEFEVQKYVPLDGLGSTFFATRRLVLIANYTYSKSELQVSAGDIAFDPIQPISPDPANPVIVTTPASQLFRNGAPLTGQSEHLVNFQLGIEDTDSLSQLTLLVNYASERVTNRGNVFDGVQLPDLIEKPGLRFDLVLRQGIDVWNAPVELKVEARNLTGTDYRERQTFASGDVVEVNSYDVGQSFSIGLGVKF